MIVYREDEEAANPAELVTTFLDRAEAIFSGQVEHDEIVSLLIDLGMLEAAIADELFPEADGTCATTLALRRASLFAGRLLRHSWRGERQLARHEAKKLAAELARARALPTQVHLKVPEGYAYYALYPETFLEAAGRFARTRLPGTAVCIGLRSIGTSLSACVAAELEANGWHIESFSLRPRGHPFARRPLLDSELTDRILTLSHALFLLIDEGPGLSGSSLCGTAAALMQTGIPERQIVLMPSSLPDPEGFLSAEARDIWLRHRKIHLGFEEAWLPQAHFGSNCVDVSGGAWREWFDLPEPEWPAVNPRHERRKYVIEGEDGQRLLHKFAGLGRYGAKAYGRSRALAEAGFIPPVVALKHGFLEQAWLPGRPLVHDEAADPELIKTAQAYFGYLAREFALPRPVHLEPLLEMMRVNIEEGLGGEWSGVLLGLEQQAREFGAVPAVAIDGRVLPHEWLRTGEGHVKTDATDHHCDHFFPGATDIAWDIAGFAVEFDLADPVVLQVALSLGDRFLPERLPFYRTAYLAFRLGYSSLSADSLMGSADGERMRFEAERYRAKLRASLGSCR